MSLIEKENLRKLATEQITVGDGNLVGPIKYKKISLTAALHLALDIFVFARDADDQIFSEESRRTTAQQEAELLKFATAIASVEDRLYRAAKSPELDVNKEEISGLCIMWKSALNPEHQEGREALAILDRVTQILEL
jgi:hypothetical protein